MSANTTDTTAPGRVILALGVYFGLHVLLRVLLSDSLDYDEAEQALLAQWIRPGYTDQPPLYTWLQYLLFQVFGQGVLAISLLKNLLLFLTYVFVYLSGREIFGNGKRAILAMLSLLLLPQICWESQRDMTHTVLVVCTAAATLWIILRLLRYRDMLSYGLLGACLAIGILAKANYALFLAVLLLALLSSRQGREILADRRLLLSLFLCVLLSSPYLLWMYHNPEIVFSASKKFKIGAENYYLKGIRSLITNSFYFYAPMTAVLLLFFWPVRNADVNKPGKALLLYYLAWLTAVLLIIVLVLKVTHVKERWLQPLLFLAPLVYFCFVPADRITHRRYRLFLTLSGIIGLCIYVIFTLRVVAAPYLDRYCRLNFPIAAFARDLGQSGFTEGVVFSDNRFLAGNMAFQLPGNTALIPGYDQEALIPELAERPIVVLWRPEHWPNPIPEPTLSFFSEKLNIDLHNYPIKTWSHPYYWGDGEEARLAAIFLPAGSRTVPVPP